MLHKFDSNSKHIFMLQVILAVFLELYLASYAWFDRATHIMLKCLNCVV